MGTTSYSGSMFDMDSKDLYESIQSVEWDLKHYNPEFIEIFKKIELQKKKFPKIRALLEDDKISWFSYKECKELQKTINLYRELNDLKNYGIFFRGGYECHKYLRKMGII